MKRPLFQELASLIAARENCKRSDNAEWFDRHTISANNLVAYYLPSGSGFDSGTNLDFDRSTPECLVFTTSFHHMDEHGGYDGWTHHVIRVRASLHYGIRLTISGRDRNSIKDHIHQAFTHALETMVGR